MYWDAQAPLVVELAQEPQVRVVVWHTYDRGGKEPDVGAHPIRNTAKHCKEQGRRQGGGPQVVRMSARAWGSGGP